MRTSGPVCVRTATQPRVEIHYEEVSSPLADLQLLRELPSAYPVSYESQYIVLLGREIWPRWNLPIHRLERYALTDVCGHSYGLLIRSGVEV
jgi:hypothetical protein